MSRVPGQMSGTSSPYIRGCPDVPLSSRGEEAMSRMWRPEGLKSHRRKPHRLFPFPGIWRTSRAPDIRERYPDTTSAGTPISSPGPIHHSPRYFPVAAAVSRPDANIANAPDPPSRLQTPKPSNHYAYAPAPHEIPLTIVIQTTTGAR